MLTISEMQQAIENLNLLIANSDMPATGFDLEGNYKLSTNSIVSRNKTSETLKLYLQHLINEIASDGNDPTNRLYIILYTTLQCFLNLEPNRALSELGLDLSQVGYLKRRELKVKHLPHSDEDNQFYNDFNLPNELDEPQQSRLLKIIYNARTGKYESPFDDKAHQHGTEATTIFLSTQTERFKAFLNWLFAKIGIYIFETARYSEHDYLESDNYAHDSAIKPKKNKAIYQWETHAENLIIVPSKDAPLHVVTDPIEGDMVPLIYPRMTEEAKLIDGEGDKRLPKIDVVLISHNHRDHLSKATLERLLKQQPIMIVPRGDEQFFKDLGFKQVVGLEWWEQARIENQHHQELLRVTAVPCKHWSGEIINAHRSAFNGYVLQSKHMKQGDIYVAGDTALMDDELSQPIFDRFNIMTSIQPGGPDENREDMKSTHQSSADGILMHFKMLAAHYRKMKEGDQNPNYDYFREATQHIKTIYNHTSTYKLGDLRLKDTFFSYQRLIAAFKENEDWREEHLANHELEVYNQVLAITDGMVFANDKKLSKQEIVGLILRSVIIPKIGQIQVLHSRQEKGLKQSFQHRNLITNRRALIEFDTLLKDYVEIQTNNEEVPHFLDRVKTIILMLLGSYHSPWHAFFSRTYSKENMDYYRTKILGSSTIESLLVELGAMEHQLNKLNQHGHMQSLVHYAKWVANFALEHRDNSLLKFKEYFDCQQVRKLVDKEIHDSGWVFDGPNRSEKQAAFRTLSDQLAKTPLERDSYRKILNTWLGTVVKDDKTTIRAMLSENRSAYSLSLSKIPKTQSTEVVEQISTLVKPVEFWNFPDDEEHNRYVQ